MKRKLFNKLSIYQPDKNITPEENFSTELFVYLMNYSLSKGTELFSEFMKILDVNADIPNYFSYKISTQQVFYAVNNNKAIPDITIKTHNEYYFIEVKVESGINYYDIENGEGNKEVINQIQKYQNIKIPEKKHIYLLTKHPCNITFDKCADFKKRIIWQNIYKLLSKYQSTDCVERYLVEEIISYMEEKKMSIPKVSYELIKGMESLCNLLQQIKTVLDALKGVTPWSGSGIEYVGYHLKKGNDKIAWVGTYYNKPAELVFEYSNENVMKVIEEKKKQGELKEFSLSRNKHYDVYFDLEEHCYFCLSPEKQLDELKQWIDSNYNNLLQYSAKQK